MRRGPPVRFRRTIRASCGRPTFAVATQAPHREVGSSCRPFTSIRAIPTGAVALRSFPLSCSGCPSRLGPCLPAVRHRKRRRRPQGLVPHLSPLHPAGVTRPSARCFLGLSCSSSEGGGVFAASWLTRQAGPSVVLVVEPRWPEGRLSGAPATSPSPRGWDCGCRGPVWWRAHRRVAAMASAPGRSRRSDRSPPEGEPQGSAALDPRCLLHRHHRGEEGAACAAGSTSEGSPGSRATRIPALPEGDVGSGVGGRLVAALPEGCVVSARFPWRPCGVAFPREGLRRR